MCVCAYIMNGATVVIDTLYMEHHFSMKSASCSFYTLCMYLMYMLLLGVPPLPVVTVGGSDKHNIDNSEYIAGVQRNESVFAFVIRSSCH